MINLDQQLPPGALIGNYTIHALLGWGSFGAVYAAKHLVLGHSVALKVLHPQMALSHEMTERFFREAQSAAIGSPHIVEILESGFAPQGGGIPFLAMELLEGTTLDVVIARANGPLLLDRVVTIALQILDGLGAAHAAGIVHRDLKPANVFLCSEDGEEFVKLLDFGTSKFRTSALESVLTRSGAWFGTPLYMAPEQFKSARDVDHRADIYSLAALAYEMLCGAPPFNADTTPKIARLVTTTPVQPLRHLAPHVPDRICAIVERGLAKDPDARWPNAFTMATALREAANSQNEDRPGRITDFDRTTPDKKTENLAVAPTAPVTVYSPSMEATHETPVSYQMPIPKTAAQLPQLQSKGLLIIVAILALGGLIAGGMIASAVLDSIRPDISHMPPPRETPLSSTHSQKAPSPVPKVVPPTTPIQKSAIEEAAQTSKQVTIEQPRIIGSLESAAVLDLLIRSKSAIDSCREQGRTVRVNVQLMVNPEGVPSPRIAIAGPAPTEVVNRSTGHCVGNAVKATAGLAWSPSGNGIVQFFVVLQGR